LARFHTIAHLDIQLDDRTGHLRRDHRLTNSFDNAIEGGGRGAPSDLCCDGLQRLGRRLGGGSQARHQGDSRDAKGVAGVAHERHFLVGALSGNAKKF